MNKTFFAINGDETNVKHASFEPDAMTIKFA